MRHCEACGRDFDRKRHAPMDCPYCGYNTAPGGMPRSKGSLRRLAADRRGDTEDGNESTQTKDD